VLERRDRRAPSAQSGVEPRFMNVFVTGVTGFVGRALLDALLVRLGPGDRVFALARAASHLAHPQLETIEASLADVEVYARALRASHYVFHLAALATFRGRGDFEGVNVRATQALLATLRGSTQLRNFVFVSTIGAVDRAPGDDCSAPLTTASTPFPRSEYGASKLRAESAVQTSALPFTIVRPGWVYGPGMRRGSHVRRFAEWVKRGSPLARIDFNGRVSLVHVRDLARALANMIDNPQVIGNTYFAATERLRIGEIFAQLEHAIHGRTRARLPLPDLHRAIGRVHARLPFALASLASDYLVADGGRLFADCNVSSPVLFAQGAADIARDVTGRAGAYVITGANGGIGRELARQLDAEGQTLVLIDRDVSELAAFKRQTILRSDLSDPAQVHTLAETLRARQIACLVNNAGVGFRRRFAEMSVGELSSTLAVNVQGTLLLTRLLIDRLVYDRACIVNVCSSVAYGPLPGMSVYAASKSLLLHWSEALAYELRYSNRVITFSPAGTRTGFQAKAGVAVTNDGRGLLDPAAVAARLLEAIEHDESSVSIGSGAMFLQLAARFLPRSTNAQLWGKLFERAR
jgi:uncharacterized protein